MSSPSPATSRAATSVLTQRWSLLDALRGFAVLGILLVNTLDITQLGLARLVSGGVPVDDPVRDFLYLSVQTRFVPVFEFLFGMSLWFVLRGARARARRPWLVLVRRLVVVALFGYALSVVYPGNVLVDYGVIGLLVLPFVLFLPRWWVLAIGATLAAAAYAVFGGGELAVPGVMLLGAASAAFGLPQRLEDDRRLVAAAAVVLAVLSVPMLLWQLETPGDPRFSTSGGVAGLVMAALYVAVFALLWQSPVRRWLRAVFEPLGRMALTNYVTGAIVVAVATRFADWGQMTSALPAVALSLAVIAVQSVSSRLWLRSFAYGPVEWVWRIATWWRPVPMLTTTTTTTTPTTTTPSDRTQSQEIDR